MGVTTSERPNLGEHGPLAMAYYSVSLFVVGGVDLGTPVGGSALANRLVWFAYFAAPAYTASSLVRAFLSMLEPNHWSLARLRRHIVIVGDGAMTISYLKALMQRDVPARVLVLSQQPERFDADRFLPNIDLTVIAADIKQRHWFDKLRVKRAARVLIFEENSLDCYETANTLLNFDAEIGPRIIVHCEKLRFLRAMQQSTVGISCITFNALQLATHGLLQDYLLPHFDRTIEKDIVVVAGYGRFGQLILEQVAKAAAEKIDTAVVIDVDARRRVLVADEQSSAESGYQREVLQGDIAHPEVWANASSLVNFEGDNTLFILGTGREEENLRTALWLRRKYPSAAIVSRTNAQSGFAASLGCDNDIINVSISELVQANLPSTWFVSQ